MSSAPSKKFIVGKSISAENAKLFKVPEGVTFGLGNVRSEASQNKSVVVPFVKEVAQAIDGNMRNVEAAARKGDNSPAQVYITDKTKPLTATVALLQSDPVVHSMGLGYISVSGPRVFSSASSYVAAHELLEKTDKGVTEDITITAGQDKIISAPGSAFQRMRFAEGKDDGVVSIRNPLAKSGFARVGSKTFMDILESDGVDNKRKKAMILMLQIFGFGAVGPKFDRKDVAKLYMAKPTASQRSLEAHYRHVGANPSMYYDPAQGEVARLIKDPQHARDIVAMLNQDAANEKHTLKLKKVAEARYASQTRGQTAFKMRDARGEPVDMVTGARVVKTSSGQIRVKPPKGLNCTTDVNNPMIGSGFYTQPLARTHKVKTTRGAAASLADGLHYYGANGITADIREGTTFACGPAKLESFNPDSALYEKGNKYGRKAGARNVKDLMSAQAYREQQDKYDDFTSSDTYAALQGMRNGGKGAFNNVESQKSKNLKNFLGKSSDGLAAFF